MNLSMLDGLHAKCLLLSGHNWRNLHNKLKEQFSIHIFCICQPVTFIDAIRNNNIARK